MITHNKTKIVVDNNGDIFILISVIFKIDYSNNCEFYVRNYTDGVCLPLDLPF